ncbi:MAG: glycoside hydrolase family 2 protein [Opitutales bacterium]|nr:glycoside hydrolase family 2 protein [Opitutales bacterium]
MRTIDLNGPRWTFRVASGGSPRPASVPGCVHTDLLAAGAVPDPWWRDNEGALDWVWREDWIYCRTFTLSAEDASAPILKLCCDGLDTLTTVFVNGAEVLRADNMFRAWEADLRGFARTGENEIEVRFASPSVVIEAGHARRPLPAWNVFSEAFRGRSYVRKMGCAFGWDWGPALPTAGIWRCIRVTAGAGRLRGLPRVRQEHRADGTVALKVSGESEGAALGVKISLSLDGRMVAETESPVAGGRFTCRLDVPDPRLWWPNGMGEQPLYGLRAELHGPDGAVLDVSAMRIGLRTVELIREPDSFGTSFLFRVNGRRLFAKGANWIPCDIFPSRVDERVYARLLGDAAESHFNMLRVWGGGIYEHPRFYDLCDELGLLVWQDFMFACSTYPAFDTAFMDNVRAEAEEAVRTLRHRPCLALWCGNNEIEQGFVDWVGDEWRGGRMPARDYSLLFDEALPEIVAREDGATPYWPCSPHTPGANRAEFNDPAAGDAHAWSVWFGGEPFEAQRKWTFRFMSEFGFQSFPEPRTVETFTLPADRALNSWVMDYHQRSGPGNGTILRYLYEWFSPPAAFEDTLWMTQLTQALCIQYAAEHARRIQGRMDGLLYWQFNDMWPAPTWSSIDVYGRWKALQFLAARFFAPVCLSVVESLEESTMELHVSNHRPVDLRAQVRWVLTSASGEILRDGTVGICVPSQANRCAFVVDCAEWRDGSPPLPLETRFCPHPPRAADRDLVLFAWVEEDDTELSRSMAFFAKPKHLDLREPRVSVEWADAGAGEWRLTLRTDVPAPWTQLVAEDENARFSDNFLHLHPAFPATVRLRAADAAVTARPDVRVVPLVARAVRS